MKNGSTSRLPKIFIALAMLHFLVGASLGVIMILWPSTKATLVHIHAEINPYGWLTFLIYGMTYAVLQLFAKIQLPDERQGWVHVVLAESALVIIVLGLSYQELWLFHVGILLQCLTPIVFLINILSGVIVKRKYHSGTLSLPDGQKESPEEQGTFATILFGASNRYRPTDKVARRGTDISLMIFVIVSVWGAIHSLVHINGFGDVVEPSSITLLVYDGWVAGTVLSVAAHLYPRLYGQPAMGVRTATVGQVIWGLAILAQFATVASHSVLAATIARVLFGSTFVWHAVGFLRYILLPTMSDTPVIQMPVQSHVAWSFSWLFAMVLGCFMMIGLQPLSLSAIHLLFLGWVTTLVYAVGYSLFPVLYKSSTPSVVSSVFQIICSVTGATCLILAFYFDTHATLQTSVLYTLFATGGLLALTGLVWFGINCRGVLLSIRSSAKF